MATESKGRAAWSSGIPARSGQSPPVTDIPHVVGPEVRESISVLVVDDEHTLRESCASLLRSEDFQVTVVGKGGEAADLVRRKSFDIVLADLYMPDMDGMDLLDVVREELPDAIYVLMTGNPSVESSIEALRRGAWDYIPKPFSAGHLHIIMGRAAHSIAVARETQASREAAADEGEAAPSDTGIIGRSPALKKALDLARRVAGTDASVFLTGESGTGKEVLAKYIHQLSKRSSRPLIPVNCAAMPESLLESELFGHVEGAFTGAVREKQGLLEVAHGGTFFLDELTEMPLSVQAKLLRVIQDGAVRRVGSTTTDSIVNVRFMAATNTDPAEAVRDGKLRKDLHYRLRVVPIHLPPLRERGEDVSLLANHFLDQFWSRYRNGDGAVPTLSDEAERELLARPWPGNVRQLRNVVEHLTVMAEPDSTIGADQIPDLEVDVETSGFSMKHMLRGMEYHDARDRVLAEFGREYVRHVVTEADGNISVAARMAGVDRTTLYRLMEKHGMDRDALREQSHG